MNNDDLLRAASKKVKAKKGFLYHLLAYVLMLAMLAAIMFYENDGNQLPVIILALTWGIGLASHYLHAFGTENLESFGISADWEEEELEKELDRLVRKRELREQIRREKSLLDEADRLPLKELADQPVRRDDLV